MSRFSILLLAAGLTLSGCANTGQLRDASTRLSAYAAKRDAATQTAVERYDELNRDLARIDEGRRRRAEILANESGVQARAWGLVEDKTRLRFVADAARVSPETLAAAPAAITPIAPLDPGAFKADFGKAVKAASKLGKTPGLKAQASSAIAIFQGVNDGVEAVTEKAQADTNQDPRERQGRRQGGRVDDDPGAQDPELRKG
jgi:hypothetical protein